MAFLTVTEVQRLADDDDFGERERVDQREALLVGEHVFVKNERLMK